MLYKRLILALLLLMMISLLCGHPSMAFFKKKQADPVISLIVRTAPDAEIESRLDIRNEGIAQAFKKGRYEEGPSPAGLTDMYVVVRTQPERHFRLEASGALWDEERSKHLVLPNKASEILKQYAMQLRGQHYGKLVSWKDAQRIFPRKSIFSITDVETGLTFRVQRRAGSAHADVQPISKKDTSIMKQIYHSGWSWKRKAIWVHSGKEWIAASMNGMPHGGDGIPDNDFSGHFCVHFLDSTTHKSHHPDLAHQLMVYKSAGELNTFLAAASPRILAESFIEGLDHQDTGIIQRVSEGVPKESMDKVLPELQDLLSIQVHKEQTKKKRNTAKPEIEPDPSALKADLQLSVTMERKGLQKQGRTFSFSFSRDTAQSPWRMTNISLVDKKKPEIQKKDNTKLKKRSRR
ncbi:hypothetical protein GCM10023310_28590 [Paenibacillus vulneris]|uniref:Uncharacterized protein n=1 Tax=Paenibacillus vulneris TaxID=1133364 RepID=A0ABW3URN3_9BACL